jgi:hypothetical protein
MHENTRMLATLFKLHDVGPPPFKAYYPLSDHEKIGHFVHALAAAKWDSREWNLSRELLSENALVLYRLLENDTNAVIVPFCPDGVILDRKFKDEAEVTVSPPYMGIIKQITRGKLTPLMPEWDALMPCTRDIFDPKNPDIQTEYIFFHIQRAKFEFRRDFSANLICH